MKVTIDNLDDNGALDYTAMLSSAEPLTLERKLNEPSTCTLVLAAGNLATPVAGARVIVSADNDALLFTGYTLEEPVRLYAGMATTGPAYTLQVSCMSDELLFNARVSEKTIESIATTAGSLLTTLTERATGTVIEIDGDATSTQIGGFQPQAGKSWSENAGAIANAARAAYRVTNGIVRLSSIGDQVHTLAESDHSLDRGALRGQRKRRAVNDITVCGKEEPQAYVTEIFAGDGATSVFQLGETPLLERAMLLSDTFMGAALDRQRWRVVDDGGHISLTSRGLTLGGGQGTSAASSVAAVDTVEMGGLLLLEMTGLEVDSASEGYFAALVSGALSAASIFAGFHVRANGDAIAVVPMVSGAEAGAAATLQTGHAYTLRLRFHCKDRQRALQSYSATGANGTVSLGGAMLAAGADIVLEIQETTGGAQFPVTVLYDGAVTQTPASCTPIAVNSVNFLGSVASFALTRPGEVWVSCTPSASEAATQRLGASAQTAQARASSTGRLNFYPGNVPASGTTIRVCYRLGGRAVARMAAAGTAAIRSLILTAEQPEVRSSADCENAALALLTSSTWADGAWKGTYACWNPQQTADVWPGDMLAIEAPSAAVSAGVIVRSVQIRATSCAPELLRYSIAFANEWAEPLSLTMREGAPENAWLPTMARTASMALVSLRDLAVIGVTATQIQVQAGMTPPTGGGFEVRRSDWKFGAADGADLVMRSPTATFTIARQAPVERYYVRIYDGATPPNYSRFSSAIFINVAMQ